MSEAVAVMVFYQLGALFEEYAVGRSRGSIKALMDLRPDRAELERDGEVVSVAPEEVAPGSVIVVRPGERVPIDGVVLEGESTLDTSRAHGREPAEALCRGRRDLQRLRQPDRPAAHPHHQALRRERGVPHPEAGRGVLGSANRAPRSS